MFPLDPKVGNRTMNKTNLTATPKLGIPIGVIDPDRLYALQTFKQVLGIGKAAMHQARDRGLEVRYVGSKAFVLGADFIRYVKEVGTTERH